MRIALVQPKYPHGSGKRQVYLPGGLMNLGSRLIAARIDVELIDANLTDWFWWHGMRDDLQDFVGISVLGTPYIPEVIEYVRHIRGNFFTKPILIGGEGIARVKPEHFNRWFAGLDVTQIRNDDDIVRACGIEPNALPSAYQTSMVPMLKTLSEEHLRRYLTAEFSLFTSQGCAFECLFCAADKAHKEKYHDTTALADEIEFICGYLQSIGHTDLCMYVSNLDAFQTPKKLEECMKIISSIVARHGITPHVRCLATSRCTFRACGKDRELAKRLRGYGLDMVAFGADGADEETWKRQNKNHNSLSELQFVCEAMEEADIAVELLMVIGFADDGVGALWRDLKYSFVEAFKGRIIRPYLAKSWTPSAFWPEDKPEVQSFLKDASLLLNLDYAMIGSRHTHPHFWQRWGANAVYLTIIAFLAPFGMCPTRPLVPVPQGFGHDTAVWINDKMPFDR